MKLVHEDPSRDIGGKGSVCQGTDQQAGSFECTRERSRGVLSYLLAKVESDHVLVVPNPCWMRRGRRAARQRFASAAHQRTPARGRSEESSHMPSRRERCSRTDSEGMAREHAYGHCGTMFQCTISVTTYMRCPERKVSIYQSGYISPCGTVLQYFGTNARCANRHMHVDLCLTSTTQSTTKW